MNAKIKLKLQDCIDRQLSIRNKELTQLDLLLKTTEQQHDKGIINRLIIPHIYSHYEGFIKNASILFLKYIIATYDPENELADNILAVTLRETIKEYAKNNSSVKHVELINIIRKKPEKLKFKPSKMIDTHSNLTSDNLREIMFVCGIQYDTYWQEKSFFIDHILLKNRNMITHGELIQIDDETTTECLSNVMDILRTYKQKLEEKI